MYNNRTIIMNHMKEHSTIYLFMTILFLTGIIFGAILVNSMNFVQKQDLFFYLEQFFSRIAESETIENHAILKESFLFHMKYLVLIFILGLSVIGLPFVWILLFIKGLVVGFSVGFLVNQLGINGLFIASVSIAPQNILIIPIYISAGSMSMIFSLKLLQKLFSKKISQPVFQHFSKYIILFLFLLAFSFVAALLESYLSNGAMEIMIKSFYQ
ncbi:stage II sporulation protein M [Virgibacillus sp. YIM 98842]|uniref:stage II sporulation protein M n=1 Tax=Virgibacillus sp. YIM 98842 TaxID=2663533 RepID=UPI0013DC70B5|nr:stage II sporulation protein M [Virgibacillus sp. YIM 98842]